MGLYQSPYQVTKDLMVAKQMIRGDRRDSKIYLVERR